MEKKIIKPVSVLKIEPTSPMAGIYAKQVNRWDTEGMLNINPDENLVPIYAIYLGDLFAAASVVEFDKERSRAIVNILNGSSIKASTLAFDATDKLTEMVNSYYNAEEVEVNYVKRKVM